ncbi:MAG: hypothetical protein Q9169_007482 [Polycauliona sp. 2 TL-2023]
MPTRVVSSESAAILSLIGDTPVTDGGWLSLRARDVSPPSTSAPDTGDEKLAVPIVLESVEGLSFMGFTDQAADAIFHQFNVVAAERENVEILSFAKGHVRSYPDAALPWADWRPAILDMGLKTDVVDRILNPRFESLRVSQTASYWVVDTITANYYYLLSLNQQIHELPRVARRNDVQIDSAITGELTRESTAMPGPSSTSSTAPPTQAVTSSSSRYSGAADHQVHPGEVDLLKGGYQSRLEQALPLTNPPTGVRNARLGLIRSNPPCDFSINETALYFSKQRQVANEYVTFARERTTQQNRAPAPVGILHVVVPRELLEDFQEIYGDTWRQFVMHCRLMSDDEQIPLHLQYLRQAQVVIGPVLNSTAEALERMVGSTLRFDGIQPWRLPNGASVQQHCIRDEGDIIQQMNRSARVWFETIP